MCVCVCVCVCIHMWVWLHACVYVFNCIVVHSLLYHWDLMHDVNERFLLFVVKWKEQDLHFLVSWKRLLSGCYFVRHFFSNVCFDPFNQCMLHRALYDSVFFVVISVNRLVVVVVWSLEGQAARTVPPKTSLERTQTLVSL